MAGSMSDAEYEALLARDKSGDLDKMLTDEETKKLGDERARRNPAVKPNDPRIQKIEFNDQGEVKKPTTQAFGMVSDMLPGALPLPPVGVEVPPSGPRPLPAMGEVVDPAKVAVRSVIGSYTPEQRAALAKSLTAAPGSFDAWIQQQTFQGKLSQEMSRQQDLSQQADALKFQAENAYDPTRLAEARRHYILHPEVDLGHIYDKLEDYRKLDASAGVDWSVVAQYHPVLADVIGDPDKAGLALHDVATLSSMDRWFGGVVPLVGLPTASGKRTETLRPVAPFWAQIAKDAVTKDIPAWGAKAESLLADAQAWSLPDKEAPARAAWWREVAQRLESEASGTDYMGTAKPGPWYTPHRLVRGLEVGTEFAAKNLPLLLGAALSGGATTTEAGARAGIWAFNTIYSAPDVYAQAKETTGSTGEALGLTAVGAPLVGKIMGWNPISSAAGQQSWRVLDGAVARAAMEAGSSTSYLRLGAAIAAKGGIDFYTGKAAFAAQAAATSALNELSRALGTEEGASSDRVWKAAQQGWRDGDAAALLSMYGTGRHLVTDAGRFIQGREMAQRVGGVLDDAARLRMAKIDPALTEQIVHALAAQQGRDHTLHLPIAEVQDALTKAGLDPKETIDAIHEDGGTAYEKAVQEGSSTIDVPVEKLHRLIQVPQLEALAREHGTLNPEVWSYAQTLKESKIFKDAFDTAIKVDPEMLAPEDRGIYDALLAQAGTDPETAKQMYAAVKGLQARVPEITLQQAHDITWGKGGLWGPALDAANEPVPGMHLRVKEQVEQLIQVLERESGLYNSREWMQSLKDDNAKADLAQREKDAQAAARERLEIALKAGVRQVANERQMLQEQAKEEIRKDTGQRARHFFHEGELWGADRDDPRLLMMTDPATGKPLKLLDTEVRALGFNPEDLGPRIVTSDPRKSMDVDMAANALGYTGSSVTGDAARRMLAGLRDALPEGEFARQWADAKLRQAHGDALLDNPQALMARVMDGVQNEKVVPALLRRLQDLSRQLDPLRRARSAMSPEAWEDLAQRIIADRTIGKLKPDVFTRAGKYASEQALKALQEGKPDKAFDHTEVQLLNHYLYRAAREMEGAVGAIESKMNRLASSDGRRAVLGKAHPAFLDFSDAVLGALGFRAASPDAGKTLDALLAAVNPQGKDAIPTGLAEMFAGDQEGGWSTSLLRSVLGGGREAGWRGEVSPGISWKDLKPAEAAEVHRALQNVEHIAKTLVGERKETADAERDRLINSALQYTSLGGAKHGALYGQRSQDPRQKEGLAGMIKHMLVGIWKDEPNLPARVILGMYGPELKDHFDGRWLDARLREHNLLNDVYSAWKETQTSFQNDPDFHKVLPGLAEELGIRDANGVLKDGGLTKAHLVQILKWYGSETGRDKILKALHIDAPKLEGIFGRYLDHSIVNEVQREHAVLDDKVFPLMSEAWQRRKGLPLEKTVAAPYTITYMNGATHSYGGGYYPVHWTDIPRTIDLDIQSSFWPKVPDGAFQARTGFVGNPDLDWANMPGHLLADLHNVAFGDFVQEGNRILLNPRMKDMSERYLGPEYREWADTWLRRVAGEGVPRAAKDMAWAERGARASRSLLVTGAIGFNLPIFAAHLTHPLVTATLRDGFSMAVSYAAPSMQRVLEGAISKLTLGHDPVRDFAMQRSKVLPLRASTMVDDMNRWAAGDYAARLGGAAGGVSQARITAQEMSFAHLREMDKLISTMIWDAKYRYEMDQHRDEDKAIKEADEQVRAAMPNYNPMEQPSILANRGNLLSAMLIFQTYWSKYGELVRESRQQNVDRPFAEAFAGQRSKADAMAHAAQFAARYAAALTVGIVGGEFLKGQGRQDNEDWTTWFMRKEATAPLKMFPYASELLSNPLENWIQGKRKLNPEKVSNPYFAPVERALGAVAKVMDARADTADKVEAVATALLMLKGFPAAPVTRAARYDYEALTGGEHPRGVGDLLGGNIFGKKYGRSSRYNATDPLTLMQTFTAPKAE